VSRAPEIKGWCPGAFAPMESGDGLLLRAKLIGPRLSLAQARAIAGIATRCGNGLIDLSQRAQLQLRGVRQETLSEALQRLSEAGLLAESPAAERVQNILAPPFPRAGAIAPDALARAIYAKADLHGLPPKFLFLIDDSALSLRDSDADIRLEAQDNGAIALALGGARDIAAIVDAREAIAAALRLARAFLDLRADFDARIPRMRALTAALGAESMFAAAGLTSAAYAPLGAAPGPRHIVGAQRLGDICFAGAAAPFGRWRAQTLAAFADCAQKRGAGELRATPWRALLAQTPDMDEARRLSEDARARGLIISGDDPLLAVVACPGAPECVQAQGDTRALAQNVAPLARALAQNGVALHVSGCAKGCAHPAAAPVTLVAHGAGADLIFDGAASDAAAATALPLAELKAALQKRAKEETPCPAH